jgi:hypothetical protein
MTILRVATFKVTARTLAELRSAGASEEVVQKLASIEGREVSGKRDFDSLLQQTIGYQEAARHGELIRKHSGVKRRRHSGLRSISLWQAIWKVAESAILGAVILLAIFGLERLTGALFPSAEHIPVDIINVSKSWVSAGMFVVFLFVKFLDNFGVLRN